MTEDPEIIRLNIRHYQELLKLDGTAEAQQQVMKLLAEAQAQLPFAGSNRASGGVRPAFRAVSLKGPHYVHCSLSARASTAVPRNCEKPE